MTDAGQWQRLGVSVNPYYDEDGITIYHADCREVLSKVSSDVVITDPPYLDYEKVYDWNVPNLVGLWPPTHAFVFWKGSRFSLAWTARHVWSKANRNIGTRGEQYEEIYELNGGATGLVMRHAVIDSAMNATINGDVFLNHPTQKPIRLLRRLVSMTSGIVLDPFMGSGTTLRAAKDLSRQAIGIEIEERYCEIAVQRLAQQVLPLEVG